MKKRFGIISFFSLLFITFIVIWNYSYETGLETAYVSISNDENKQVIPSEIGIFQQAKSNLDYLNMPIDDQYKRSLATYYDNRAFHGAPPNIPHTVVDERNMGGNSCLKCHENGGFVEKFNAYTPITPHPEMVNCRQCHVPQQTQTLFKNSDFEKIPAPLTGVNNALEGSPPAIPHQIQMRENCLSCHASPSAPKEIRVSHPERINCRQCHVPDNKKTIDIGVFKRKHNNE